MRVIITLCAGALLLAGVPALAQKTKVPYQIDFDPRSNVEQLDRYEDKEGLFLSVRFTITLKGEEIEDLGKGPDKNYKLRVTEDNKPVKLVDLPKPQPSDDLAVVLAVDVSSRMKIHGMDQTRRAADVFFKSLPAKADCGLILFNDKVVSVLPLTKDRQPLRQQIETAVPRGGTAYFDAAEKAINMLAASPIKARALVILTDGVDINSNSNLDRVVARAKKERVRIYTIGIGEPGRQDLGITSVLVLDKSGSMNLPAKEGEKVTKLEALKGAADMFVNGIGYRRRATVVEFSDDVAPPKEFTNNKFALRGIIKNLVGKGETAVFDAVYTAIMTLDADPDAAGGKRAVVALTDGIDNSSRRSVEEVIARAKETNVPLFMLGFGRKGELDVKTMERMAQETKGKFFHAENQQALIRLFEDISIELHDDGIDEISLGTLAAQTGGKYYAAKNVSKLDFVLQQVTKNIQRKEYRITFASLNQRRDGVPRVVSLELIRDTGDSPAGSSTGEVVSVQSGRAQVHGLVIAEMHPLVYLVLLAILGGLIALPGLMKRRAHAS